MLISPRWLDQFWIFLDVLEAEPFLFHILKQLIVEFDRLGSKTGFFRTVFLTPSKNAGKWSFRSHLQHDWYCQLWHKQNKGVVIKGFWPFWLRHLLLKSKNARFCWDSQCLHLKWIKPFGLIKDHRSISRDTDHSKLTPAVCICFSKAKSYNVSPSMHLKTTF